MKKSNKKSISSEPKIQQPKLQASISLRTIPERRKGLYQNETGINDSSMDHKVQKQKDFSTSYLNLENQEEGIYSKLNYPPGMTPFINHQNSEFSKLDSPKSKNKGLFSNPKSIGSNFIPGELSLNISTTQKYFGQQARENFFDRFQWLLKQENLNHCNLLDKSEGIDAIYFEKDSNLQFECDNVPFGVHRPSTSTPFLSPHQNNRTQSQFEPDFESETMNPSTQRPHSVHSLSLPLSRSESSFQHTQHSPPSSSSSSSFSPSQVTWKTFKSPSTSSVIPLSVLGTTPLLRPPSPSPPSSPRHEQFKINIPKKITSNLSSLSTSLLTTASSSSSSSFSPKSKALSASTNTLQPSSSSSKSSSSFLIPNPPSKTSFSSEFSSISVKHSVLGEEHLLLTSTTHPSTRNLNSHSLPFMHEEKSERDIDIDIDVLSLQTFPDTFCFPSDPSEFNLQLQLNATNTHTATSNKNLFSSSSSSPTRFRHQFQSHTQIGTAESDLEPEKINNLHPDKMTHYLSSSSPHLAQPLSPRSKYLSRCISSHLQPIPSLMIRKAFTKKLDFQHLGMGDEMGMILAHSLSDLPYIESVDLTDNRLTDIGLVPLLTAISQMKTLLELNLSNNKIDSLSATVLASYLIQPHCVLTKLTVCHGNLDDFECEKIVSAIQNSPRLVEVSLSYNLIGSAESLNTVTPDVVTGGEALGLLFSSPHCRLKTLRVDWNVLRMQGAVALGSSLSVNHSLTHLDLSYNSLARDGGLALGSSLPENSALETLILSHNAIDSIACFTICAGIIESKSLKRVVLDGNPIGEFGAKALMVVPSVVGNRVKLSAARCNIKIRDPDERSGSGSASSSQSKSTNDTSKKGKLGIEVDYPLLPLPPTTKTTSSSASSSQTTTGNGSKGQSSGQGQGQGYDVRTGASFRFEKMLKVHRLDLSKGYERAIAILLLRILSNHHSYEIRKSGIASLLKDQHSLNSHMINQINEEQRIREELEIREQILYERNQKKKNQKILQKKKRNSKNKNSKNKNDKKKDQKNNKKGSSIDDDEPLPPIPPLPSSIFPTTSFYNFQNGLKYSTPEILDLVQTRIKIPLDSFDEQQLHSYQTLKKLESAATDISQAIRLFHEVDSDGSGSLEVDELDSLLQMMGLGISKTRLLDILAMIDIDQYGSIEIHDFIGFLRLELTDAQKRLRDLTEQPIYIKKSVLTNTQSDVDLIPYLPPKSGLLILDIYDTFSLKKHHKIMTSCERGYIEEVAISVESATDTLQLISHGLTGSKMRLDEAIKMLDIFQKENFSLSKVLSRLLPQMSTTLECRKLVMFACRDDHGKFMKLKREMGMVLRPILGNPMGYYCLDLSKELDRLCFLRLLELSITLNQEKKEINPLGWIGLNDSSQKGNYSCFRNEMLNGVPIILDPSFAAPLPTQGRLEFDFSGNERPKESDMIVSDSRVIRILVQYYLLPVLRCAESLQKLQKIEKYSNKTLSCDSSVVISNGCTAKKIHEISLERETFYRNLVRRQECEEEAFQIESSLTQKVSAANQAINELKNIQKSVGGGKISALSLSSRAPPVQMSLNSSTLSSSSSQKKDLIGGRVGGGGGVGGGIRIGVKSKDNKMQFEDDEGEGEGEMDILDMDVDWNTFQSSSSSSSSSNDGLHDDERSNHSDSRNTDDDNSDDNGDDDDDDFTESDSSVNSVQTSDDEEEEEEEDHHDNGNEQIESNNNQQLQVDTIELKIDNDGEEMTKKIERKRHKTLLSPHPSSKPEPRPLTSNNNHNHNNNNNTSLSSSSLSNEKKDANEEDDNDHNNLPSEDEDEDEGEEEEEEEDEEEIFGKYLKSSTSSPHSSSTSFQRQNRSRTKNFVMFVSEENHEEKVENVEVEIESVKNKEIEVQIDFDHKEEESDDDDEEEEEEEEEEEDDILTAQKQGFYNESIREFFESAQHFKSVHQSCSIQQRKKRISNKEENNNNNHHQLNQIQEQQALKNDLNSMTPTPSTSTLPSLSSLQSNRHPPQEREGNTLKMIRQLQQQHQSIQQQKIEETKTKTKENEVKISIEQSTSQPTLSTMKPNKIEYQKSIQIINNPRLETTSSLSVSPLSSLIPPSTFGLTSSSSSFSPASSSTSPNGSSFPLIPIFDNGQQQPIAQRRTAVLGGGNLNDVDAFLATGASRRGGGAGGQSPPRNQLKIGGSSSSSPGGREKLKGKGKGHQQNSITTDDKKLEVVHMSRFRQLIEAPHVDIRIKAKKYLDFLEEVFSRAWLCCRHLALILKYFKKFGKVKRTKYFGTYSTELAVSLFDRIVDLHNFELVFREMSAYEIACFQCRVGMLNTLNPTKPDGYYELDLSQWEERVVAKILCVLAVEEGTGTGTGTGGGAGGGTGGGSSGSGGGGNEDGGLGWKDPSFRWMREMDVMPGWELTQGWLTETGMPDRGILALGYGHCHEKNHAHLHTQQQPTGSGLGSGGVVGGVGVGGGGDILNRANVGLRKSLLNLVLLNESELVDQETRGLIATYKEKEKSYQHHHPHSPSPSSTRIALPPPSSTLLLSSKSGANPSSSKGIGAGVGVLVGGVGLGGGGLTSFSGPLPPALEGMDFQIGLKYMRNKTTLWQSYLIARPTSKNSGGNGDLEIGGKKNSPKKSKTKGKNK